MPAVQAILDRVLGPRESSGCFAPKLTQAPDGHVSCAVIEARYTPEACARAKERGRAPVSPQWAEAVAQWDLPAELGCVCEIAQAAGEALAACQSDAVEPVQTPDGATVNGWCYVDAEQGVGSPEVVQQTLDACSPYESWEIRFVGDATPVTSSHVLVACEER